ncbi:hypothetical protein BKA65DRAFT_406885, partial [Rhexocercosporidium sp. MPI-PUGE-AT-0058]
KLLAFPPSLNALYERMMKNIYNLRDAKRCKNILAVALAVQRPLTLDELPFFVDMPPRSCCSDKVLAEIIGDCTSFLTLRERIIFFVYQSVKDFLIKETSVFTSDMVDIYHALFSPSLQVMFIILRRDIYSLIAPGTSIDQIKQSDPDPLAAVRYSCSY